MIAEQIWTGHALRNFNCPGALSGRCCASGGPRLRPVAVTTPAGEKRINTFMRLDGPGVIALLREDVPQLPDRPDAKTVFAKLRELRNSW